MRSRWIKRTVFVAVPLLILLNFVGVAVVTEGALQPPRQFHAKDETPYALKIEQSLAATARLVSLTVSDGARLSGWWLVPKGGSARVVIVCHGIGDSAMGSLGFAPLFLRNGFAVLVPESRGHGDSGGQVTYGLNESKDILDWLLWIRGGNGSSAVYGLGESLGGAILLQSLAHGADFRALIAECPYASFREVANDRVGKFVGPVLAPVLVEECLLYAKWRYHLDLAQVQPSRAVSHSQVPILLIHGAADNQTPPRHSEEIVKSNPAIRLWLVPHAPHVGAYATAPTEFESHVISWFQR